MRIEFLKEPELEFGTGRHIDIKFGLMNLGPLDFESPLAPKQIKLGVVGSAKTLEGVYTWFERCRSEIGAKESKQPNLFARFPGFNSDEGFRSTLLLDQQLQRAIRQSDLDKVIALPTSNDIVTAAVNLFLPELSYLVENTTVDVLVCAVPLELLEAMDRPSSDDEGSEGEESSLQLDFHHMLKAAAMSLGKPIQIILPMTYDERIRRKQKTKTDVDRKLQDEATRAWNIHTALYYKAGGVPWRMVRESTDLTVCYIGVSFYKTLDGSKVMTSMAQVFNQRGEGVIVRGAQAKLSKDDKQPRLSQEDAQNLLTHALRKYREVHHNFPARVVLHKSSGFSPDELTGFQAAVDQERIELFDFLSLTGSYTRLFRIGAYPPLRGTLLNLDDKSHVLYTRGAVDFFETYPGLYVPRPLMFRCDRTTQTARALALEILALSKMNWNKTQFDGSDPISLWASRQVGSILKYVGEQERVEPRYCFYM